MVRVDDRAPLVHVVGARQRTRTRSCRPTTLPSRIDGIGAEPLPSGWPPAGAAARRGRRRCRDPPPSPRRPRGSRPSAGSGARRTTPPDRPARPDGDPDLVALAERRGLGLETIEQCRLDGERESSFHLGVGQRVAEPLQEPTIAADEVGAEPGCGRGRRGDRASGCTPRRRWASSLPTPCREASGCTHTQTWARSRLSCTLPLTISSPTIRPSMNAPNPSQKYPPSFADRKATPSARENSAASGSSARSAAAYTSWKASMSASSRGSRGRITSSVTAFTVVRGGAGCNRVFASACRGRVEHVFGLDGACTAAPVRGLHSPHGTFRATVGGPV